MGGMESGLVHREMLSGVSVTTTISDHGLLRCRDSGRDSSGHDREEG